MTAASRKQRGAETQRTVTFSVDAPAILITANTLPNLHYMARARLVRAWREAACGRATAERSRYLADPWPPVHVEMLVYLPEVGSGSRMRDVSNLQPTAKAILDGIVDSGLLADDDDKHVVGPDLRRSDMRRPVARFTVTLTEIGFGGDKDA